jgi:hypothetical protein
MLSSRFVGYGWAILAASAWLSTSDVDPRAIDLGVGKENGNPNQSNDHEPRAEATEDPLGPAKADRGLPVKKTA